MSTPQRIAVLRFSSAGDVVLTAPALHALVQAWPKSHIIFVTHAPFAPLLRGNPHVHEVVALPRKAPFLQLRQRLKSLRPDALLDLHGKLRGTLLRASLPLERYSVWQKRPLGQSLAVRFGGARYNATMHIAARYHQAVERLVGTALPRQALRYYVTPAAAAAATALLTRRGVDSTRPLIGISPGAMWETKRWPVERFAALATWATARGFQVVLTGSPSERPVNARLQHLAPATIDLTGEGDLEMLGGIIASCQAFVANDSGPMHVARALGVPTLAIFGSTDPKQFSFAGHQLLFNGLDCSPCSFHGLARCPRGHMACLRSIEVAQACNSLAQLVTQGPVPWVLG